MNIDRMVMLMAGTLVLTGLALGVWGSPYFFLLPAFVGLNLMQASLTGFCPAAILFRKLGVPPGGAF